MSASRERTPLWAPRRIFWSAGKPNQRSTWLIQEEPEPGQDLPLTKPHPLRSTASMTLTPGPYSIVIQVNGRRFPAAEFHVPDA
ncbi:hypothetical protein [Streptomyces sp. NPDC002187]|uniref:hypothetical protein n=1 Tax=Streptomyces sp. NPDC002187 TaxID=3364637 RepID=UPI0036AC6935